jgi:phosphoadenosine phosphosulfate reductase
MAFWRDGAFADDEWRRLGDDEGVETAKAIVSLKRWRREAEALRANGVGVEIDAGPEAQGALAEVSDRPLVALKFDKFGDGRAFSYAILLRERYGLRGELRAVGDVLLDEIPLMLRCGFTSFEISNGATLRALQEGRLPSFPLAYQPGLSKGETREPSRPWARRLASA